jgi:hypothetical protein
MAEVSVSKYPKAKGNFSFAEFVPLVQSCLVLYGLTLIISPESITP